MSDSISTRLQESSTWSVVSRTNRTEWLAHCASLPSKDILPPQDDEIFTCCDGLKPTDAKNAALQRLNRYGITSGQRFVTVRSCLKNLRFNFGCVFHSTAPRNNWDLELEVTTNAQGHITSKRQRNTTHQRCGCPVLYSVCYSKRSEQWIGRWKVHESEHSKHHPFPFDPTHWTEFKREISQYRDLEVLGQKLRISKVSYADARRIFRSEGIGTLMTQKEYYNLTTRAIKDISSRDTPAALLSIFDELQWRYLLRIQETDDERKIIQIFFWCDRTAQAAKRYCSGSLVIVDATFRTSNRGLPLIIAAGVSSTSKTFPLAFSWAPEEDAASYHFFFESLRNQMFSDVPEPGVVLADLSAGMTCAYDSLRCLPNTRLQHCQWHALEAMKRWFRDRTYTAMEQETLIGAAKEYLQSPTEEDLIKNRSSLVQCLLQADREYITQNWQPRETRIVDCYVQQYPNLGYRTTQRCESFNVIIHKVTNHQLSMRSAAQSIIDYVEDFFRDFDSDLTRAQAVNLTSVPIEGFRLLRRTVTLPALELIRDQWKLLSREMGYTPRPCTRSFCNQYLLPCAHTLQRAYRSGEPIPRSLLHPRWWVESVESIPKNWRPLYGDEDRPAPRPILARHDVQMNYESLIEQHNRLDGYQAMKAKSSLCNALQHETQRLRRIEPATNLPLSMPDPVARFSRVKIPTTNEAFDLAQKKAEMQAKAAQRSANVQVKDAAILAAREAIGAVSTTNVSIQISEKTPSPPPHSPLTASSQASSVELTVQIRLSQTTSLAAEPLLSRSPTPLQDLEPPSSTAPAVMVEAKRTRRHTLRHEEMQQQQKRKRYPFS